jgi:hypothetical protein
MAARTGGDMVISFHCLLFFLETLPLDVMQTRDLAFFRGVFSRGGLRISLNCLTRGPVVPFFPWPLHPSRVTGWVCAVGQK